ncbi:MAG: arsenate reductase [candidate division NC10 bacterium RIFCSPLOWO2_12_FULL_66_18]|nr:MAG: arsenate reductase [candidate division NC10 bacterium RIFCSPLOWO2_02_FULL_66_22]OGB99534.1 MAG: arsenate reductase [candidate division NC10 bacterium RIFCSPLOWO2_12_FULL_66_18]
MERPIRIMFVCTGNSARSQMAEAFCRVLGQRRVEAKSAGTEPKGLNPNAVRVMQERGIDISNHRSEGLDVAEASEMDYLITVCGNAEERCPVLPAGVMRIHWPLEDPAAATGCPEHVLEVFRRTRDEIEARVLSFLARLGEPCP